MKGNQMHIREFLGQIESTVLNVIRSCYPSEWEEDFITLSLTKAIAEQYNRVEIEGLDRPFNVVWDARKLKGKAETRFGDLGIVIKLTTWEGESVEGVALLEAKRRKVDAVKYDATRKSQLQEISKNAAASSLLLYDYDGVLSCMDNLLSDSHEWISSRGCHDTRGTTQCVCVPIGTALCIGKYTTALHKFGLPFSYQLVYRYLRGFDLEFAPAIVDQVKGNHAKTGPRLLILVGVSTGSSEATLPSYNQDVYGPLNSER